MVFETGIHRFEVGALSCLVICDIYYPRDPNQPAALIFVDDPAPLIFANATSGEISAALDVLAAAGTPTDMSNNILLVDTGQHRLLVDTGNGQSDVASGHLLERLAAARVAVADIDIVIMTHGHFDHVGANADSHGQPTFPNARYIISQAEWAHQMREPDDSARVQLLAIADRVEQVATDAEIVPGIRALPAPGHSPGQIALLIESGGERLLHLADVVHHPIQLLYPDWYFDFDDDPALTVATRHALLSRAAHEQVLVLAYHLAFPGLGKVIPNGSRWQWVPSTS